jgi:hypothetical protein
MIYRFRVHLQAHSFLEQVEPHYETYIGYLADNPN